LFTFKAQDVTVPALQWIGARLDRNRGGCIFGHIGTGKSHAARKAAPGALRVDVARGPLLGQRFAADLARQLGGEGRKLLESFRSEGLAASLCVAEQVVNGHPLVVDGVERLLPTTSNLDDPAATLWQDEKQSLLAWLQGRLDHSPTFLVGRRRPPDVEERFYHRHEAPSDWPIRLEETSSGYPDWPTLGELAGGNPAVLTLARALVPLLTAPAFNELVSLAKEDDETVVGLLRRLGQAFQSSAPPSWQRVLALVGALGEIPRDVFDRVLDRGAGARAPEPLGEERSTLERLRELRLVEERSGGLALLPSLVDAGATRRLTGKEREELLPAAAHALLATINDPGSLVPEHADRVLRAHAIFIELGDMSMAEHTATLHVHGLIELARRTSLDRRPSEAWRQYDGILRMMQSGRWSTEDPIGRRLHSYVRHYRTRDGALAGMIDNATCLAEYRQALADWPDNALWHQRVIETLIRLGRPIEAVQAMDEAYQQVAEHPRRDELLRVRPATVAMHEGLPILSLELIDPVFDRPPDLYPELVDRCRTLLQRWEQGLAVAELPFRLEQGDADGRVVFHEPMDIELRRAGQTWVARLHGPAIEGRSERPRAAIETLARHLAVETRRLVSTPSGHLGARDVRLKGRLLALVDVLDSDIGLAHASDRWIVGRIEDKKLVPTMRHLPSVQIPDELLPESVAGLYLAHVPVHRDGIPSGPAMELVPAGSGRDTRDLLELLARMSEDAA
jgi:hypothetical protein